MILSVISSDKAIIQGGGRPDIDSDQPGIQINPKLSRPKARALA
jgi:hypothetical protein